MHGPAPTGVIELPKIIKLIAILTTLILTSCSEPNKAQALRIGTNLWPGYEPLYLAREKGYFESEKIRLIEYTSASQVIKAYKNGLLDAAAVTLDEAIALLASGEQPRIVLVMDISNGADVMLGQPSVKTIADIKGKRVGVEHTALGAYFINRVIEKSAIDKSDITVVPLTVNQHERAFVNKKIDAVLTFEPVRTKLLNEGANILFDSSQIPGEIVDVLIVDAVKMPDFKEQIKHLENGWFRALDDVNGKEDKTITLLGSRMKISSEEVLSAYEGMILPSKKMNDSLIYAGMELEPGLLNSTRRLSQVMYENKLISSQVKTEKLFSKK